MSSRKNILHKITEALHERVDLPFRQEEGFSLDFAGEQDDLSARFSKEFTMHQGKLIVCNGKKDLLENLQSLAASNKWKNVSCQHPTMLNDLQLSSLPFINKVNGNEAKVGITDCECLVARTGSILLSAVQSSGRTLAVSAPVHLVIAKVSQLVFDIGDAIDYVQKKYGRNLPSALFFVSGPSRTGDIERTLVIGVHGPVEVYVLLLNDEESIS